MAGEATIELAFRISNYYKVRDALVRMSSQDYYRGMFKRMFTEALEQMRAIAASVTHRETGQLAGAHRWEYDSHRMTGRLYIDPRIAYARGSRVQWPSIYGVYEHRRGGSHAFYQLTYEQSTRLLPDVGLRVMIEEVDRVWR